MPGRRSSARRWRSEGPAAGRPPAVSGASAGRLPAEVALVEREERLRVVLQEVHLAARAPGFAGLEAAEAEIGVQADDDALEELLVRLPGEPEEQPAIGGDAAD